MDKTPVSIMTNIKSMCPTFSIIIPHYDIPDLLMRCLKSIPVSEDIQVIVVDDNSPNADTYLERYPELSRPYLEFIRTPKNGGAGYARNIGLDHAKGKWLLFADADDFFVDNMYDIITTHAESDADVIYFQKQAVFSDDINRKSPRSGYIDKIMDIYLKTGDELPLRTRYGVPWGKMIKKNLTEKHYIRFEEIRYSEDILFSVHVGCFAKKIEAIDMVLYVVTSREGSAISDYCKKPNELRIRAGANLNVDKFLMRHGMDRGLKQINRFLKMMLKMDKPLFCYYFHYKLHEVYPSQWAVIKDLFKGTSIIFKLRYVPYVLYQWLLGTIKTK